MRHKLLLLTLALLVGGQIFSQEKMSLSLAQARDYAIEHNRTLKNASLDIQKIEASRWQSIATMLPQVNGAFDYANMLGHKLNFSGMDIAMPPNATFSLTSSVMLSAAQIIGLQINSIAMEMTDITLRKTEQQITNQVKTIYYSVLVMEQTVGLLQKNLENLNKLQQHTLQSVEVGIAEQTDADQISVQVASMGNTVRSTKRSLEMLYNSMRLQLGVDADTEIQLTQSVEELMNFEKAMSLIGEQFILDNNFNYQLLKQNITLIEKQVDIKKWAYLPSISAFHQFSKKEYFSDEPTFDMTPPNMIGVSLNVPVFSSGSRYRAVTEAKIEHQKQLNVMADTKESLAIQHRQLQYNLSTAFDGYDTQKKNIEVSQRVFNNISLKYQEGMASSLDVTNSGTNLILAQSNYVQALMELVTAQVALEELLNNNIN
ncbi:MAG TPA: TolC family protein [Prolixibacteraceae bacterium]|nr:TolC family protein [Prolixibacteraceae bacterium]